jgi:hypothetical protein
VARQHNCSAIVVENLNFADARATGRETLGRGAGGKRLRRTVAGIPTRRFRIRLIGMATGRGIAVIGIDPAYTSRWGAQHWRKPLQQQTSDPAAVTVHHGAAAAWPRHADQATAGRTPHPTEDERGHTTGQAGKAAEPHTAVRKFRPTATPTTTTRHAGPPDNTHRQRPTPFGPHRTHS